MLNSLRNWTAFRMTSSIKSRFSSATKSRQQSRTLLSQLGVGASSAGSRGRRGRSQNYAHRTPSEHGELKTRMRVTEQKSTRARSRMFSGVRGYFCGCGFVGRAKIEERGARCR